MKLLIRFCVFALFFDKSLSNSSNAGSPMKGRYNFLSLSKEEIEGNLGMLHWWYQSKV